MSVEAAGIVIPRELRPRDGRFGSGPSKVRPEALDALAATGTGLLGTSHRQEGVRSIVRRVKHGLSELFGLPAGFEVLLGNGGTTAFWDALAIGVIENLSQHAVFGEFSSKFAECVRLAPHLADPELIEAEPGTAPGPFDVSEADFYALCQNETSTGVQTLVRRPAPGAFTAVDATSAAGGLPLDPHQVDIYYFAPQKCFASDGGLWIALCSPAAIERIEKVHETDRYIPPSLDLAIALDNSRKDQTYNTPALATLFMLAEQLECMLDSGGLEWAVGRCARSADILYGWSEGSPYAEPFVKDPEERSRVVATIDLADAVDGKRVAAVLRANGIVDTEPYRKLGRNQLRIALYPAIEPSDVELLTRSIDHVVEALGPDL